MVTDAHTEPPALPAVPSSNPLADAAARVVHRQEVPLAAVLLCWGLLQAAVDAGLTGQQISDAVGVSRKRLRQHFEQATVRLADIQGLAAVRGISETEVMAEAEHARDNLRLRRDYRLQVRIPWADDAAITDTEGGQATDE